MFATEASINPKPIAAGTHVTRFETKRVQAICFHFLDPLETTEEIGTLSLFHASKYIPYSEEYTQPPPTNATRTRATTTAAAKGMFVNQNAGFRITPSNPEDGLIICARSLPNSGLAGSPVTSTITARVITD